MNELMTGDFYQTLITLILFDCILLLLVNLLKRKPKRNVITPSATPPTPMVVDLNQRIVTTNEYTEPEVINKTPEYETLDSKITGKRICYYPTKDGEQPYSAYKMNYF